jgi:hypothetical protein
MWAGHRARILFVVGVSAFMVASRDLKLNAIAACFLFVLALALRVPRLLRRLGKLIGFSAFIMASFLLFPDDPTTDRFESVTVGPFSFMVNFAGVTIGLAMVLRVIAIVLASQIARVGDERAIARGLRGFGVPEILATSVDAVLSLIGGGGGGGRGDGRGGGGRGGGGRGGGGWNHGSPPDDTRLGFWLSVKKLARGDIGPLLQPIERALRRAERHFDGDPKARDAAVISGLALAMLGVKALKILPSIPFAPGHKLVLLTPIYVAASLMTRGRLGSTTTGSVMGIVSFLSGDGKYGVFEIAKHIAPGLVCDALVPTLARRPRSRFLWCAFSALTSVARYAVIFLVTLVAQPPSIAFAFLLPGLAIHLTFGILAGLVIPPVVRAVQDLRPDNRGTEDRVTSTPSTPIAPPSESRDPS